VTDPAAGQDQPEVDQLDVDQPEAGPLSEWDRLLAQITELDSLVRTVAWGVQHETSELRGALEDLAARVAELEPPEVEKPDAEPQAFVDYATAEDWQALAAWVDWLVTTYDFLPSKTVLPCWPAHRGVVEELAALRTAWRMAAKAGRGAKPNDALIFWHDRWLHSCLARLREHFQQKSCSDKHSDPRPGKATNPDLLAAALPGPGEETAAADGEDAEVDTATGELL